ncbi:MAG: histidinol-phosphate transaminase [Pseudomonadales bacterium]
MTVLNLNRRLFLGGSAALTGAVAAGAALPARVASASVSHVMGPAYGPEPGVAKLNANENPYGPSDSALVAMYEASKKGAYYVGETVPMLKSMIAERHNLTTDHIAISAGSSGVLTYLATAKLKEGKILGTDLFWDTTSKMAARQGGEIKRLPKTADLGIDLDAMYAAITDDVSLVHICNPNNPQGTVLDGDTLRAFCRKASKKATVLVDEAYNELTDKPDYNSMVDLVREGHNVVVARTFSKIYGLAGMRIGYMMAAPETIELLSTYGLGDYAMNQAGVAAAVASYNDFPFLEMSKSRVVEAREMVIDAVSSAGLKALPSATNFVFVDLGKLNAETFRQKMAERNVLIRGIYRDYTNWSRVSMGLLPDVEKYVAALPAALDATRKATLNDTAKA